MFKAMIVTADYTIAELLLPHHFPASSVACLSKLIRGGGAANILLALQKPSKICELGSAWNVMAFQTQVQNPEICQNFSSN